MVFLRTQHSTQLQCGHNDKLSEDKACGIVTTVLCIRTAWSSPSSKASRSSLRKFPAFYGTRSFITAFTTARHLFLFCARSIQSTPQSHLSKIRFNIILPSTPGSFKSSSPQAFPPNPSMHLSCPHTCHMLCLSQCCWDGQLNNVWWGVQSIKLDQCFRVRTQNSS